MTRRSLAAFLFVLLVGVTVWAHQETYKGTVLTIAKEEVRVDVVDAKTKKVAPRTFVVDAETKVLRGDTVVTFATARIVKGEAISVTTDHDLDEDLALVIRLGAAK